jgi:hypothetical protein
MPVLTRGPAALNKPTLHLVVRSDSLVEVPPTWKSDRRRWRYHLLQNRSILDARLATTATNAGLRAAFADAVSEVRLTTEGPGAGGDASELSSWGGAFGADTGTRMRSRRRIKSIKLSMITSQMYRAGRSNRRRRVRDDARR